MTDRRLHRALLRGDFAGFVAKCFRTLEPSQQLADNWHIHHIAWQLSRLRRGELNRLIINIPPRHLKSICVTVAFTAWVMGHDPSQKILTISYTSKLSEKHAADFRTIVESEWYGKLFPAFRIKTARKDEIFTTERGHRIACSINGRVTGLGADLIILDDPINALDALSPAERQRVKDFYDNTAYTRLDDKARGAIIIVMQRLHQDDLVGHVTGKEDWETTVIPAIATHDREYRTGPEPHQIHLRRADEVICPAREDISVLHQIRRSLGSMNFSAQYQQEPIPPDGTAIKRPWIRYYEELPPLELTVVSWDTASTLSQTSDYSVGTVWGLHRGDIYLVDVIRGQWETPDLRRLIERTHIDRKADATIIEDTGIGRAIAQEMRRGRKVRPIPQHPRFDKEARLLAQASKFEAGQVLLPREAPWLGEYLSELLAFPNGAHDDQVDSTSQALNWLSPKIASGIPPVRPNPRRPSGPVRRPAGAA